MRASNQKLNLLNLRIDKMKQPDPKLHQRISFAKSALRIAAGIAIIGSTFILGGALIIAAEILGIIEELV